MSVLTKLCTGLLISTLSVSAYAAQGGETPDPQSPVQEPTEATVEVGNTIEVIQVLHIGVSSETKIIDLVKERNPDEALQQFIDQLTQDVTELSGRLQELAASKSVSLAPEQMTENAKMIEAQMAQQIQALQEKTGDEFRQGVIEALSSKYQKALELYAQIEAGSTDAELKAIVSEFRPVTEKHLETLQQLQGSTEQPTQPAPQHEQPTE